MVFVCYFVGCLGQDHDDSCVFIITDRFILCHVVLSDIIEMLAHFAMIIVRDSGSILKFSLFLKKRTPTCGEGMDNSI